MTPDDLTTQALDDLRCPGAEFRPPPSAREIVHRLRERGATVEATEGGFRVHPARLLTDADRAHLEVRLDDLENLLGAERRPTVAPALRARMAGLLEQVRERLGDETSQRLLALFREAPERAIAEAETALAARAAAGKVSDAAMAIYRHLLHEPGRGAGFGAILNRFGNQYTLRGRDDSKEYAGEVARVAELLGELEDAGLAERQGTSVSAVLPEGVSP